MFLLFGGNEYYPGGGMADFRGRFISVEDAEKVAKETVFENDWSHKRTCDWWHIVDAETLVIVRSSLETSGSELNAHIERHT